MLPTEQCHITLSPWKIRLLWQCSLSSKAFDNLLQFGTIVETKIETVSMLNCDVVSFSFPSWRLRNKSAINRRRGRTGRSRNALRFSTETDRSADPREHLVPWRLQAVKWTRGIRPPSAASRHKAQAATKTKKLTDRTKPTKRTRCRLRPRYRHLANWTKHTRRLWLVHSLCYVKTSSTKPEIHRPLTHYCITVRWETGHGHR